MAVSAAVLVAGAGLAHAQDAGDSAVERRAVTVQPRISVSEVLSDNVLLSSTGKDAALMTTISPGLRVESRAGRIRGSFDYSLNGIIYTKSDVKNQTQQSLAAQGVIELVEQQVYVDGQATISQQTLSAFGPQSTDTSLFNPNRTEIYQLSVSPYWRGRLSNWASFELRAGVNANNAKDSIIGDSDSTSLSLSVDGNSRGKLNWWSRISVQKSHFKQGDSDNQSSVANLGLRYTPDVDLVFSVNGGPERNDYGSGTMRNSSNYGASATWTPSPRTKLLTDWQHHDYGDGHSFTFEHRMARSVWRYSDVQSVTLGQPNGSAGATTLYSLLYQQCLTISKGDPADCAAQVNAFLAGNNLSPTTVVPGGFLASTPTMQRLQDLSFSLNGIRSSVLVSLSQSSTSLLSGQQTATGDLAQSSEVRQRSLIVSLSHRLTPVSSIYTALSIMQSRGDTSSLSTSLRSITGSWSSRFGRASVSLGGRYTSATGASSYSENAVTANLVQQF